MSQLTPPRVLKINLVRLDPVEAYGSDPYPAQAWKFRVRFFVEPQLHSDTRTPRPGIYNGLDVIAGDYITTQSSKVLKIIQIEDQTSDRIIAVVQDINRLNSSVDPYQAGESAIETGYGLLFTAPNGLPLLYPMPGNIQGLDVYDLIGIIGRFFYSDAQGFNGTGYTGSRGATGYVGSQGPATPNINVKGSVATTDQLPQSNNQINDAFFIDVSRELWVWSGASWFNAGQIVGPQGIQGYTGSQGEAGPAGPSGVAGTQGDIGYTGSQGPIGYTGSQGISGYVGSRGAAGYTGSQGDKGDSGPQGIQGFRGYQGSQGITGYTGSRGLQGISGTSGYTGSTGYTGSQGVPGEYAALGYTGSQGDPGPAGPTGHIGYTGSIGPIGYAGSRGDTGFVGSHGYTGSVGFTGPRGFTGSQGVPGPNGIGGATIDQSVADDGSVLVYRDQVNTWSPTIRLDAQTIEGGFF